MAAFIASRPVAGKGITASYFRLAVRWYNLTMEPERIRAMSDRELEESTAKAWTDSQNQSGMSGEGACNRLRLLLTETQLRFDRVTGSSIAYLRNSINDFNLSSEWSVAVIIRLTCALLFLTLVMVVPVLREFLAWGIHGFRLR